MIRDLSRTQLAERLAGEGLVVRTGPLAVRLGTTLGELAEPLGLLYANYEEITGECIVDVDVRVRPAGLIRRWLGPRAEFLVDGRARHSPFPRRVALAMMEWAVNWCSFSLPHQYLMLHSVVVARDHLAALLPGPPGAGKSTLCAALVHRGWRLLSDEQAVLRPPRTDLIPVPRPIGLKGESIEIIRRFAPEAVLGPNVLGTRKGTVAHVQPPQDSVRHADQTARPRWIVFPAWSPDRPAELAETSKAQTLLHVAADAFNFSVLGREGFETLSELVDTCDCYELRYGHLDEAVAVLDELHSREQTGGPA